MEPGLLTRFAFAITLVGLLAEVQADVRWDASLEIGVVDTGPAPSFADHSQGKLRYGSDDDPLQILGGYLQIESDLDAVWNAKVALNFNPQDGEDVGVVDAFIQFRPLPDHGIRWRVKAGAFRPPVSLEHGADAWAALYTTNASAINSWVGEELGHFGIEVTAKRDLASTPGDWYWALSGAVFYGNDVAGTVLSWRGWSLNNWQTPWGGVVPLMDIPIIQGNSRQAAASEPFLELDDDPGYYGWVELGIAQRARVRVLYWDNHADPAARGHDQSGWRTRFWSFGLQANLPGNVGLLAQAMDGMTDWGPIIWGGERVVNNGYDAQFLMLTKTWDRHRYSVRRDWFTVDDLDFNPYDPNAESGAGWTASYQFSATNSWTFGFEYLRIHSDRPARTAEALAESLTEDMVMLVVRWRR